MRAYTEKLRTKAHETCEDDYFSYTHPTVQRGAYLVADGLSGFAGDYASNFTITQLGLYFQELLEKGEIKDLPGRFKEKIIQIHRELLGRAQTTLDSVVVSDSTALIHHLGDSRVYFVYSDGTVRQVTKDESKLTADMGPANSVGGVGRINEDVLSLEGVKYIFLTTDGLMSRVTEQQITTLLGTLGNEDAPFLLPKFVQLIKQPKEKLREYRKETLYEILRGVEESLPPDKDLLVDLVFKHYGRTAEVTKRVDKELKVDDTTMILVDLEDAVSKSVAVQGIRQAYDQRIQELRVRAEAGAGAVAESRTLRDTIEREREEKKSLTEKLEKLQAEYQKLQEGYQQEEVRLKVELSVAREREGRERELADALKLEFTTYKNFPWWKKLRKR